MTIDREMKKLKHLAQYPGVENIPTKDQIVEIVTKLFSAVFADLAGGLSYADAAEYAHEAAQDLIADVIEVHGAEM